MKYDGEKIGSHLSFHSFLLKCLSSYDENLQKIKISHKMSENVKVMVRCRPFNPKEDSKVNILSINDQLHQITVTKFKGVHQQQRTFTFDHIFGTQTTQTQVYEQTAFLLVQNVLQGYNGTIFAYGQTGCGKTYTMNGSKSQQSKGIIPRTFNHIITRTTAQKQKQFLMHCSYIQIYNEEVYDLFEKKTKTKLEVKEAPGKGTFIKDQKLQIVKSVEDMQKLFELGSKNRAIRETSFNKHSSRSHCIFTVYIESSEEAEGNNLIFKAGKLNLVDLAGSERQSKLKLAGEGFKETTRINLSLSALGNVISALVDGKTHHIPYRDSKLTRLLQDSLGGNTKTVMIATISPAQTSFEETLSTLRYASRTKFIKNKPIINEDPKDTLLRQYAEQIRRLKIMLDQLNANIQQQQQTQQNFNLMNETGMKNHMTEEQKEQLLIAQQEREELRKKLQALERILAKEEVEEDASQIDKINKLKDKLKEQQWKQQQYLIEKQKREEELLYLQTNYKSLNEEVDLLRGRFNELKAKYVQSQQENKDLRRQFQTQKQDLLNTIREQELEISKYKGITEMILTERHIQLILNKSKIDEEERLWDIKPFIFKENMVIFPEATTNSLGELVRKEKNSMNMFVSENLRKNYTEKSVSSLGRPLPKNTKQTFSGSQGASTSRNRNKSLSDLKSVRERYSFKNSNNTNNKSSIGNSSKIANILAQREKQKKNLNPIEEKKKLNIDLGRLKLDILSELSKSKVKKT